MPHKCLRCGAVYADNDESILRGCSCGSIFFLLMVGDHEVKQIQEMEKELQEKDTSLEKELMKQIEEKKKMEVGTKVKKRKVRFGIETIRIPRPGVYEINIDALMKKKPIIILERERVYIIHLPSVFEKLSRIKS